MEEGRTYDDTLTHNGEIFEEIHRLMFDDTIPNDIVSESARKEAVNALTQRVLMNASGGVKF